MPVDSDALVPGPWVHHDLTANGTRFHFAELGEGPLVLLLHGFPQFWWQWRHQLPALAEAGYRVVAPDLRGYGASDKPPRGYDLYTLSADVAAMVRALGERSAIVVGHDWGGTLAWAVASLRPEAVSRLVVASVAHPLRHRQALLADPRGQLRASWWLLAVQTPYYAERELVHDAAARVEQMLCDWAAGRGRWTPEELRRYREAMLIPGVAHCSLEHYRWLVRSLVRPTGIRFFKRLQRPVQAPTLHLHGALDPCVLPRTALGSGRYVAAAYEWRLVEGAGHFLPEEAPELVTGEILRWAKG